MKNKIFAIDEKEAEKAIQYAKALRKRNELTREIFSLKVGLQTILGNGISILRKIKRECGLDIICDLKLSEIPAISGEIARTAFSYGADGIVLQGFVGEKTIDVIYDMVPDLKIYLVSEMTHNDGGFTQYHLEEFAQLARKKNVFGIIGPGNRPEQISKIKNIVENDVKVVAAGIYRQGGEELKAFEAGADYIILGTKIREILDQSKEMSLLKWRQFFIEVGVYFATAFLIALLLINMSGTRLSFFLEKPVMNISVAASFAILALIVKTFVRKRDD